MKRYARVVDGLVVEIIELPKEWDLGDVFVPEIAATIFPAGASVLPGWIYADGKFTAPPPPPPPPYVDIVLPADVFWQRTTEDEADQIDTAMMAKSVKIRKAYQAATVYREGTDLWAALSAEVVSLFGQPRHDELMARPSAAETSSATLEPAA